MRRPVLSSPPFLIAVLISGGGTTLKNILSKIDQKLLDAHVALVVSSSSKAKGLNFAQERGIPTLVAPKFGDLPPEEYSEAIFEPIRNSGSDLVVMGGFLKHVLIPIDFSNRVINIHPSLIPAFCGQGFYGLRVHQAVLDQGCQTTGCTVHYVDNEFDHGPVIAQIPVEVHSSDNAEILQQRVFEAECRLYPEVIQSIRDSNVNGHQKTGQTGDESS
jgi:phosphoribosylglycinamide formyltransferase 1